MFRMLLVLTSLTGAADAGFWRYTDKGGVEHITNDFDSIPPEFRSAVSELRAPRDTESVETAQAHQKSSATIEPALQLNKRLDTMSPKEAEQSLRSGSLTVNETDYLVQRGVLRASAAADSIRHARTPEQLAADRRAAQASRLAAMETASGLSDSRLSTVSLLKAFMADVKDNPKFKWALWGELGLAIAMIIALPFAMRQQTSDANRRIVRLSFLMIFGIVSATGNLVLFRAETETLLRIMNGAPAATAVEMKSR